MGAGGGRGVGGRRDEYWSDSHCQGHFCSENFNKATPQCVTAGIGLLPRYLTRNDFMSKRPRLGFSRQDSWKHFIYTLRNSFFFYEKNLVMARPAALLCSTLAPVQVKGGDALNDKCARSGRARSVMSEPAGSA